MHPECGDAVKGGRAFPPSIHPSVSIVPCGFILPFSFFQNTGVRLQVCFRIEGYILYRCTLCIDISLCASIICNPRVYSLMPQCMVFENCRTVSYIHREDVSSQEGLAHVAERAIREQASSASTDNA